MPYFNTNKEEGATLRGSRKKVLTQEDIIFNLFDLYPTKHFTPFDVQRRVLPDSPITSVRARMNTLTELNLITKTDSMKPGIYGKMNHSWKRNLMEV